MFTLNVYILSMVISAAVTFLFSPFRKAMFGRPPGSIRIVSPSKPAILPRSNRTTRTEREDSVEGRRTAVEGDASKENGQIPIHKESIGISVSELVKSNVPSFQKGYKPSWWLSNGHLQTAYCVIGNFTRIHKVTYVRQLLRLPDGGTVSVDTSPPNHTSLPPTAPTVVIAHGLTGGSHESYVRNVVEWVVKPRAEGGLGGRAVVSNYRGCAGTKITSPQFYSAGYTGDYHTVVSYVHSQFPASPLVGAGFSLGASVLARYMGEEGERCALTGGVVLGCPWDIPSMSHTLETGWISQRIYSSAMCKNLMRVVLGASHSEGNKSPITLAAASTSTSTSTSTHTSRHSSTVSSGTSTPNYSTSVTSTGSDIDIPILFPYHNENIPIDQVIAHFVEQKKGNLRLRDFDDYVTCLYGGLRKDQSEKGAFPFKDADAYYEWASSKPLIKNVKRPLLGVNAFDDPVIDGGECSFLFF